MAARWNQQARSSSVSRMEETGTRRGTASISTKRAHGIGLTSNRITLSPSKHKARAVTRVLNRKDLLPIWHKIRNECTRMGHSIW